MGILPLFYGLSNQNSTTYRLPEMRHQSGHKRLSLATYCLVLILTDYILWHHKITSFTHQKRKIVYSCSLCH